MRDWRKSEEVDVCVCLLDTPIWPPGWRGLTAEWADWHIDNNPPPRLPLISLSSFSSLALYCWWYVSAQGLLQLHEQVDGVFLSCNLGMVIRHMHFNKKDKHTQRQPRWGTAWENNRLLVPSQWVFKENEAHHTDLTNRTFYLRQGYHTKEKEVLILYVISYSKIGWFHRYGVKKHPDITQYEKRLITAHISTYKKSTNVTININNGSVRFKKPQDSHDIEPACTIPGRLATWNSAIINELFTPAFIQLRVSECPQWKKVQHKHCYEA